MRAIGWIGAVLLASGCGSTTPADNTPPPSPGAGSGSSGAPAQHILRLHVIGRGRVVSSAPAFSCANDCQQTVDASLTVHLAPTPDPGWKFDGWQGDCSGPNACDLAMTADHAVNASFSPVQAGAVRVSISLVGSGTGTVHSSPAGVDCRTSCDAFVTAGTTVSLTAQADANSTFAGWGGGACSGPGGCSFVAGADVTVWADFEVNPPPPPPPPSSCANIAPPADVGMQQYVAHPPRHMGCLSAAGNVNGVLALPMRYEAADYHGSQIGFVWHGAFLRETYFESENPNLFQQPTGFISAGAPPHMWPYPPVVEVGRWDASGESIDLARWYAGTFAAAPSPRGGLLLAGDLSNDGYTPSPAYHHEAVLLNGVVLWGPRALASSGPVFGAGVDVLGRSLVITGGASTGTITAQWFEVNGIPLTGEFTLLTGFVAGASTWFETSPLVGGGLVVRRMDGGPTTHAQALVTVMSGSPAVQAAPRWMRDRPDTRLQITRGGAAYAVLPYGKAGAQCTERLEIVAPDGTSCGWRDYPVAAGTCTTQGLTLAEDGTVVQQLPSALETSDDSAGYGYNTCTWRFWTGAVR